MIHVHPGPVVTLYEFEPAPGTKSSRVIALSDDIARSMSAVSARVAVIAGRNAIGVELPNHRRETVYLRELLASQDFETTQHKLALCLGKTIGGEAVIADLARMPHLLVAGTTGSGKSVAINTMILSLLYRLKPEECRLIMVDPKMLELSVYDGIPHLLTPVVTDPKKAIIALRWAVREMEERYKKMSKLGVRNIDGFNARVREAAARGEVITRTVQTGFDRESGQALYEDEVMDLEALPYIVVIVDEMADLMMVAGKEIEGAIQRLAQMARAAGIHVVLATQRPSVDVITGTIKANFPTRISFQVTSKIDSRTILGEMGAEQLLGQGDMLYMAGGGRITRVHGPFCSDDEVEKVVAHLKRQGKPVYLDAVTADDDEDVEDDETPVFDEGEMGLGSGDLYDQAVSIVLRHRKASTSYIQRRLQIGYNRAASIMERMEKEGVVGPANHAGQARHPHRDRRRRLRLSDPKDAAPEGFERRPKIQERPRASPFLCAQQTCRSDLDGAREGLPAGAEPRSPSIDSESTLAQLAACAWGPGLGNAFRDRCLCVPGPSSEPGHQPRSGHLMGGRDVSIRRDAICPGSGPAVDLPAGRRGAVRRSGQAGLRGLERGLQPRRCEGCCGVLHR